MIMFPKPEKPLRLERHDRRKARVAAEDTAKRDAKRRDGRTCRWPRCEYRKVVQPLDAAHVHGKGMGGTPDGRRNVRENLMAICRLHHQGRCSLHSGDLHIEPLTPQGTDGPCAFFSTDPDGKRYMVAQERAIRQYERDC